MKIMRKFKSKKNGQTADEVKSNEQMITLKLQDGVEKTITIATLKRWWEEIKEEQEEVGSDEMIPDPTPIAEMGTPVTIIDNPFTLPTPKSKKGSRPPKLNQPKVIKSKEASEDINRLVNYVENLLNGIDGTELIHANSNDKFRYPKYAGSSFMVYVFSKSKLNLWIRSEILNHIPDLEYEEISHRYSVKVTFTNDDAESRRLIESIITKSFEIFKEEVENKKSKKTKKANKN